MARAEQSRAGLVKKLRMRGFSAAEAAQALDRLAEEGMVDDLRFAGLWVNARLRHKPASPRNLRAALRSRGIDRKTAEEAVKTALEDAGEAQLLQRYIEFYGEAPRARLCAEGFSAAALEALPTG